MKRIVLTLAGFLMIFVARAQTIEEAKKHMYYERFQSAENVLKTVINKQDASPDAWYWLAQLKFKNKNISEAEKILNEGKVYFDKNKFSVKDKPLLELGLAHLMLIKGNKTEAMNKIDGILNKSKYKNPEALYAAAKAHIDSEKGDINWAIELLEKAARRDKKNPAIYTAIGDAYRKLVDGSRAVVNYDRALTADPTFVEALYKKGKIYKTQKNVEVYTERFMKAVQIDDKYAPALYELYYINFYSGKLDEATRFLEAYIRQSDPSINHSYMKADLMYIKKEYKEAITLADDIIKKEGEKVQPRLYKLLAYSYAAQGDSVIALEKMNLYFEKEKSEEYVVKDFDLKARLLATLNPDKSKAITWFKKAMQAEEDKEDKLNYMLTIADMSKQTEKENESYWRKKIYETKENPTNLDLYKWGIALYTEEDYHAADSIFAMYSEKYPEQVFGYLWRARSNALIDTTMELGLAVPHYQKLIEVASVNEEENKSILLSAYGYMGSYKANVTKDFAASIDYFNKMLKLDPQNEDAARYVEILKKWVEDSNKTGEEKKEETKTGDR